MGDRSRCGKPHQTKFKTIRHVICTGVLMFMRNYVYALKKQTINSFLCPVRFPRASTPSTSTHRLSGLAHTDPKSECNPHFPKHTSSPDVTQLLSKRILYEQLRTDWIKVWYQFVVEDGLSNRPSSIRVERRTKFQKLNSWPLVQWHGINSST